MSNNTILLLQSFLEKDPNDSFTRFALAMEHSKIGDLENSEQLYRDLVRRDPNYVGTYYHLGMLLSGANRVEEAREVFNRGLAVAQGVNDHHAASELRQALDELDF